MKQKITLTQIKKLRELSKAGIMDCRRALEECQNDFPKAQKWLQEKGAQILAKKEDRTTAAGVVEAYIHNGGQVGSLVKLSCETDFVCCTSEFRELAHELAMQVAAMNPKSISDLLEQEYIRDPQKKIKDLISELVAKVGEKIKIEAITYLSFKNDR